MNVLIFIHDNVIKGWLIKEPLESAEVHIRNGYPDLLNGWLGGTVKAMVVDIPESDAFKPELYEVKDGQVVKKENI